MIVIGIIIIVLLLVIILMQPANIKTYQKPKGDSKRDFKKRLEKAMENYNPK